MTECDGFKGAFGQILDQRKTEELLQHPRQTFYIAIDPARDVDFSALAVIQAANHRLQVRNLKAFKHVPYPRQAAYIRSLVNRKVFQQADTRVLLDSTGVGGALADLLVGLGKPLVQITATSGKRAVCVDGRPKYCRRFHVPKIALLSELLVAMQSSQLEVAEGLALGPLLERQLGGFKARFSAAGNITFQAEDTEANDDLISALALAAWYHRKGCILGRKMHVSLSMRIAGARPY